MNKFLIKNSEVSENAVHGIWGPELSCWSLKTDDLVIDCIEFLLNCEVLFRWTDNKMEVLNPSGSILEGSQCQQCSPPMELKSHIDIHFQKDFANMPLFLFLLSWFPLKIFSSKKKKRKYFPDLTRLLITLSLSFYIVISCLFSWFYCILKAEAFQGQSVSCPLFTHLSSLTCSESLHLTPGDLSVHRGLFLPISYSCFSGSKCVRTCSLPSISVWILPSSVLTLPKHSWNLLVS